MRRNKETNEIWIILGVVVLFVAAVAVAKDVFRGAASPAVAQGGAASSTPAEATTTIAGVIGKMYLKGNNVTARGSVYTLSPVASIVNPGRVAVEGVITQIIPDPATTSQTPYYYVIQDHGDAALVGVVVPVNDAKDFSARTFPVGTDVLIAGIAYPSGNPNLNVFDYGELLQELHVAAGLRNLGVPPNTLYLGANFQDIGILG